MPGIYIHIPFCKQACTYCNFHFSTTLTLKGKLLQAISKEIALQKDYLHNETIETIYIGGGTPSLLTAQEINKIFEDLHRHFTIANDAECTIEANPDDLTHANIQALRNTPINRFSIGIQSFTEADLRYMTRAHNAQQALQCVPMVQDAGFDNISIDLIFGTPTLNDEDWIKNMEQAFQWNIAHISAYGLTVEENTALAHQIKANKTPAPSEEKAKRHMLLLIEHMTKNGYIHYEVSNFAKPEQYSKHNSSYWLGKNYLGIGPSAHSYNTQSRQWNIPNNVKYIKSIAENKIPKEVEILTESQKYNEYVMVSIRTIWGVDLEKVAQDFGEIYYSHLIKNSRIFQEEKHAFIENNKLRLTTSGILIADHITANLFY